MTDLGALSVWVALLMAVWGTALSWAGGALRRAELVASGRRGLLASAGFTALASGALWWALGTGDFSLRYVASFTSATLPTGWRLSAFPAGAAGSVLAWALAVSSCLAILLSTNRREEARMPWVAAFLGTVLVGVLAMSVAWFNPFSRLASEIVDGRGLDPGRQNLETALQGPLLYVGYAAALIVLALAVVRRHGPRTEAHRERQAGAWAAVAWVFLLGGALVGLRWSYAWHASPQLLDWRAAAILGAAGRFSPAGALVVAGAILLARRPQRHAGLAALAIGALASAAGALGVRYASTRSVAVRDGETFGTVDPWGQAWTLTSQGASRLERANYFAVSVALAPVRGTARQPFISSEQREYVSATERDQFPAIVVPGILSTVREDVRVVLTEVGEGHAQLRVDFIPLAPWIWIGGVVAACGGAVALWPARSRVPSPAEAA